MISAASSAAAIAPASGHRSATPATAADAAAPRRARAPLTTPKRRRPQVRADAQRATCRRRAPRRARARRASAQRPTKTLTSRSSDQPSSISIERTARDRRSQSVSCDSTRSADVHVSLQKRSSVTLPEMSSSARHASRERRPRAAARLRLAGGSATSGGDSTPRIRPRTRASGWMKCRYATVARYQSLLPGSESTSDRSAYAMFFAIVDGEADQRRCRAAAPPPTGACRSRRRRRPRASARTRRPASGSSAAGTRTDGRRCGRPTETPPCPRRRR